MAYLVIIVVDNSPHEAGDVISWRDENMLSESGHYGIGTKTLQDERFKIVHIPEMTTEEANVLCRPQGGFHREVTSKRDGSPPIVTPANPDAKIRAYKFDTSLLRGQDRANVQRKNKAKEQRYRMKPDNTPEMLDVENLRISKVEFDKVKVLKPVIDNRVGAFVREIS